MGDGVARRVVMRACHVEDSSSGPQHLEAVQGERYRSIMRGGMYWQQYAQGFGWGMTIRSARTSHILMRATMPPTGELGLTRSGRAHLPCL